MTGAAWRLAMAAREPDQAGRLRRFRDEHPRVEITPGEFGTVRALIPAQSGSRLTGREVFGRSLRELLGKLEQIFGTHPDSG